MSTRPGRWSASLAADPSLALVLAVLAFVPFAANVGPQFGDLPLRHGDALGVLLALGMTLPLAVRTRWPAACFGVVAACFVLHETLAYPPTFGALGLLLALYTVAAHQNRGRWAVAVASTALYAGFCVVLTLRGSPERLPDFVLFYLALLVGAGIGALVRSRRAAEAVRRRFEAEAAKTAERARIARELHDVVTHHVTAMVVQASAARYLIGNPDQVGESLTTIGDTGRQALKELRSLLKILEATGDQGEPALDDVADLVVRTRLGGQPVELVEEGERTPLPTAAELAGYRVVQEALTNAVKYAGGHRTVVRIGYRDDTVDIEVTSDGTGDSPDRSLSGGRGLTGLEERVRNVGGELTAGAVPGGGFRVHATIPTGDER
ncbi:signal transduction histidine kinase [Amycolatopsis bartoniae]|nr:sensor histidine kinase [Amycolatopsis bartoniae]MBB2938703.1 signal transduction histidine kinase [Amycolatopsis bartoniae]TVT11512.1 sensor histidine kinase [Amycolatopsis bartoniae]